ncbi:DUF6385 domain-containing protein [Paenibacillus alkaliterrae]|uniref:DUF6385 domain-containing protein n=1 Tax=Paenibacillus alkaliterrae TaxID=320909 RepID=UPI001F285B9B|nr:DUF6385 domain-containing protein [Paenibacillus alkaliterrae]
MRLGLNKASKRDYIPYLDKHHAGLSRKIKLDANMIRKALQSNYSLAKSFYGVARPPVESKPEYAKTKLPECPKRKKRAARPKKCMKAKKRKACSKPKRKHICKCHPRKRIKCRKKKRPAVRTIHFVEKIFKGVTVGDHFMFLPSQNTSLSTNIMYMIQNRSDDAVLEIQVEVSPDDKNYFVDTKGIKINPKQNYVTTPLRFAKFTRVGFRTLEPGTTASVDVNYQTQTQLLQKRKGSCKKKARSRS